MWGANGAVFLFVFFPLPPPTFLFLFLFCDSPRRKLDTSPYSPQVCSLQHFSGKSENCFSCDGCGSLIINKGQRDKKRETSRGEAFVFVASNASKLEKKNKDFLKK